MRLLSTIRPAGVALALALGAASTATAQGKLDTVYRYNPRTQRSQTLQGTVSADALGGVVLTDRKGDEDTIDSTAVLQIVWGDLPTGLAEGRKLARRGDFENAVARMRDTASDDSYREPVRAAARFEAAKTLLDWGTADAAHLGDAVSEAERFLADFPQSRFVPEVRGLKARAAWLSGDAAAARDGYRALWEAGKDGAEGYAPIVVAEAALHGAQAALDAGDASGARELFSAAEAAFGAVTTEREAIQLRAADGADVASLGDALAKIASEDFSGARSSLERAATSKETMAGRGAARLALAQANLGMGNHVDAMLDFAWVSALDHSSADRRAAALVGLARTALARGEESGAADARAALLTVQRQYASTPAAAQAAEMLKGM